MRKNIKKTAGKLLAAEDLNAVFGGSVGSQSPPDPVFTATSLETILSDNEEGATNNLIVDLGGGVQSEVLTAAEKLAASEFPKNMLGLTKRAAVEANFEQSLSRPLVSKDKQAPECGAGMRLAGSSAHESEGDWPSPAATSAKGGEGFTFKPREQPLAAEGNSKGELNSTYHGLRYLAALFQVTVPSKSSGYPLFTVDRDFVNRDSGVLNSGEIRKFVNMIKASKRAVEGMNTCDREEENRVLNLLLRNTPTHRFFMAAGTGSAKHVHPLLHGDSPKVWDYNSGAFIDKAKFKQLIKKAGLSPEELVMGIAWASGLWAMRAAEEIFSIASVPQEFLGTERTEKSLRASPAHYLAAVASGSDRWQISGGQDGGHALAQTAYVDELLDAKVISLNGMLQNGSESSSVNDYLFSESGLNWILSYRLKSGLSNGQADTGMIRAKILSAAKLASELTELVDESWRAYFSRVGWQTALTSRFGHPVGIRTRLLKPWHFFPGGHLVDSGYVSFTEAESASFRAPLVPKTDALISGQQPGTFAMSLPTCGKLTINALGRMARFLAMANEFWYATYNRGLPLTGLYYSAGLTQTAPSKNGTRANTHFSEVFFKKHGFELVSGPDSRYFATPLGRVGKINSTHKDLPIIKALSAVGIISTAEIEDSNRSMAVLTKGTALETSEADISRLRLVANNNHPRTIEEISGNDFYLLGTPQRADALACFIERPGTYLRRSGLSGVEIESGAPRAVYEQVLKSSTPWLNFLDPALGRLTDGVSFYPDSKVAREAAGRQLTVEAPGFYGDRLPRLLPFVTAGEMKLRKSESEQADLPEVKGPIAKILFQIDALYLKGELSGQKLAEYKKTLTASLFSLSPSGRPSQALISKRHDYMGIVVASSEEATAPITRCYFAFALDTELVNSATARKLAECLKHLTGTPEQKSLKMFFIGKVALREFYTRTTGVVLNTVGISSVEEVDAICDYLFETRGSGHGKSNRYQFVKK